MVNPLVWLRSQSERLALLVGAGLVVGGVAEMHAPSATILAGVLLIVGVLWRKER